ncbi:hypothetical protein FRC06_004795 [Ceratobasidium sp. 370]|nr:hypothetical protein FRC06_004795 [Ceratobasidium sp. 370]
MTPSQAAHINRKRLDLNHKSHALLPEYLVWLGLEAGAYDASSWLPDGATLKAPSQLTKELLSQVTNLSTLQTEEKAVRQAECMAALQDLALAGSIKALLIKGKRSVAKGQSTQTRAQNMLQSQSRKVDHAAWRYHNSKKQLDVLLQLSQAPLELPNLEPEHITSMMSVMLSERAELGEGQKAVPWFLKAPYTKAGWELHGDLGSSDGVRVEWFRGRERWTRWQEEAKLLKAEMLRTINFFTFQAQKWNKSLKMGDKYPVGIKAGFQSYAEQQSRLYHQHASNCHLAFRDCLQDDTVDVEWSNTWMKGAIIA